jgi:hypothetical protein
MSLTDPPPDTSDTLESGEPMSAGPFRRRNLVVGLATVAVLAAAATGVALAADSGTPTPSGSPSASPNAGTQENGGPGRDGGHGPRGGPGMMGGPGFGIAGPMGALHGEFVAPKQGGGYQTLVVQRGKVSSVSSSSITVKSDDGFSATYDVPATTPVNAARDGIGSIKKGDDVTLVAEKKSGNDTALQVGDLTRMQGQGQRFGFRHDKPRTPTPAPTGTTGSSSFGV